MKPARLSYLTVVLDTGASLSLIRESCLPTAWKKGTVERPHPGMKIVDANGNRVKPTAVVLLYVQVGRSTVRQRFLVVPNLSVPCILGCDFIDREVENISPKHRYIIMGDGERVHIGKRRPKYLSESSVRPKYIAPRFYHPIKMAKRTLLQPGHTTLVSVTTAAAGLQILTPKPSLMLDKRVQMANGVVNIRPNVPFQVEVTNFGSKRKVLPKNMVISSVGGSPHSTLCIDMHDK